MTRSQSAAAVFSFFLSEILASASEHIPQVKGSLVPRQELPTLREGWVRKPCVCVCVCVH